MRRKRCPLSCRALTWLLVLVLSWQTTIPIGFYAWAQSAPVPIQVPGAPEGADTVRRPEDRQPGVPPDPVLPAPQFSADPTSAEIFRTHFLEHPLMPVGSAGARENSQLVDFLNRYSRRENAEDPSMLVDFIREHPGSPWKAALLLNLGTLLRQGGYFSRATAAWQEAWNLTRKATDLRVRALADTILGQLVQLHAWAGRTEALSPIFEEIQTREILGGAREIVFSARQARWAADHSPEDAYKCGPLALRQILSLTHTNADLRKLFHARSTRQGFSLHRLKQLADESGLRYQVARRKAGGTIPAQSVVHWKFDHYGVIAEERGGKYLVQDTAFTQLYGPQLWISKEALEEETDGYFLIPAGPLPADWEPVSPRQAQEVFGRGGAPNPNPDAFRPADLKSPGDCPKGMAVASAHLCLVSLNIVDTPLWHSPPRGPAVEFTATYNQRDPYTSYWANHSNLGPGWTFGWLSYISDYGVGGNRSIVTRYVQGGGRDTYANYNSGFYEADRFGHVLQYVAANDRYVLEMPDGSKLIYAQPGTGGLGARKMFLTSIQDSAGNSLTLAYDPAIPGKLLSVTDAIGQSTLLHYFSGTGLGDDYRIASVEDPFGRFAYFEYDTCGRLKKITDMGGLTSAFDYASEHGSFISRMTTPYGTSTFSFSESLPGSGFWRELIMTDPNGDSEKVRFAQDIQPVPGPYPDAVTLPWQTGLDIYRNTFYWDKKGMELGGDDVANATVYHWLHDTDNGAFRASEMLESLKPPLQSRIYFLYPGQTDATCSEGITLRWPSVIARVVDDSGNPNNLLSQATLIQYNDRGNPISITDPANRQRTLDYYANGIDLFRVSQIMPGPTSQVLAEFGTYDARHRPASYKNAACQSWTFGWNSFGQLTRITDPKGKSTWYGYFTSVGQGDPRYGQLSSISRDWQDDTATLRYFNYDSRRRLHTVTDSETYSLTFDYDDLDRLTRISYPNQTFEQYEYSRLDLVAARDRTGRRIQVAYDSLGRPLSVADRLGRVTSYSWCGCGGLASLSDALNPATSWVYDVAGRPTSKSIANNLEIQYAYETYSGRLHSITDAKGQVKSYAYNVDGTLAGVSYAGGISTPSVSFGYDLNYRRLTNMVDGTGTTAFNYNPVTANPGTPGAGRLSSVTGPLATTAYSYDELGRITGRTIDTGPAETVTFDELGRVESHVTALGTFTLGYTDITPRLETFTYPNGQWTSFTYLGNSGDHRLSRVWNKMGSATVSKFDYSYDVLGRITKWTRQLGASATPEVMALEYDREDQLLGAVIGPQGQTASKALEYAYDAAGNRIAEQVETVGSSSAFSVITSTFNGLNQLTARSGSGSVLPVKFRGKVNEPATVTISVDANPAEPATMQQDPESTSDGKIFTRSFELSPGSHTAQVVATDFATPTPHSSTANYTLSVAGGEDRSYSYDDNGNCTASGATRTYDWDAENRLVAINDGPLRSEFTYDGFGRRVKIVEYDNNTPISTKQFIWDGATICQERDGFNAVTKRFYFEGQQNGTTSYYYTRDHLGSVREVTDSSGVVQARYDYDPYGRVTKLSETVASDFLYTGHYYHAPSGLHLALYRAYDADTGRWLNRDPIAEAGGLNLYGYVGNNPVSNIDPLGLRDLGSGAMNQRATGLYPSADERFWPAMGIAAGTILGAFGGAALFEAAGPSILGWLGLGGAALGNPQGQRSIQPMLAAIDRCGRVIFNPNLMLTHKEFARQVLGTTGTSLPPGTWVGTVGSVNGQIVGLNSATFFGNQLPASPQVQQAIQQALR